MGGGIVLLVMRTICKNIYAYFLQQTIKDTDLPSPLLLCNIDVQKSNRITCFAIGKTTTSMFLIYVETSRIEHVHEAMKKIYCLGPSLNFRGVHGPPRPHYSHWRPPQTLHYLTHTSLPRTTHRTLTHWHEYERAPHQRVERWIFHIIHIIYYLSYIFRMSFQTAI